MHQPPWPQIILKSQPPIFLITGSVTDPSFLYLQTSFWLDFQSFVFFLFIQFLAHLFVSLNYIVPATLLGFLLNGSNPDSMNTLNSCLGNVELNYLRQGKIQLLTCDNVEASSLSLVMCYGAFASYFIFSNNILEAILLYKCFKIIRQQTLSEIVKSLIGENSYEKRRK